MGSRRGRNRSTARPGEAGQAAKGRGLALGNGFIDGFGVVCQPAEKHAVGGKLRRSEFGMAFDEKPIIVHRHFQTYINLERVDPSKTII